jgi:hypothetical protein
MILIIFFANMKWTIKTITDESKKYQSKADFYKGNSGCYSTCMRRFPGLIDNLFNNQIKPVGYWSKDTVIEEAKKYKTKYELRKNCSSAYTAALKNHPWLLDDLYKGEGKSRWNEDLIRNEACKYSSKSDFKKNNSGAYSSAIKRFPGLLDKLFKNKYKLLSKEDIILEAKKFKSKSTFQAGNRAAYMAAWGRFPGLLDELYGTHIRYGKRDSVYVWKAIDNIYKIGVTSFDLGIARIKTVSKQSSFMKFELLKFSRVKNSRKLEAKLLKLGTPYTFNREFSGCKEFRIFTDNDLAQALFMIDEESIQE